MRLDKIFVLILLLFSSVILAADPSKDAAMSGFQFLEEPTSPEIIGLGYAGVASGGMGGIYYNPAKYLFLNTSSFHLEFGRYKKADANKVNFELSIPIKKAFISYGMRFFSVDDIGIVDDFGDLPYGSFSERGTKISLGTGFELNKYLNFGISVSGVIHNILNDYAYGLNFGAGVIGSPIPGKLNVGLSIVDFGFTTGMYAKKEKLGDGEKLPMNSRLGVEWHDTLKTIDYRLLFDIVYRNVWDRDDDFSHRISDRFTFPVGLEVRPVAPLAIRLGKRINFPTEIINMGMGLNTSFIDFDFGLVVNSLSGDGEADWTASFTYHLVKKKSKKDSESVKTKVSDVKKEIKPVVDSVEVQDTPKKEKEVASDSVKVIDTVIVDTTVKSENDLEDLPDTTINDSGTLKTDVEDSIDESKLSNDSTNVEITDEEIILDEDTPSQHSLSNLDSESPMIDSIKVDEREIETLDEKDSMVIIDSTDN